MVFSYIFSKRELSMGYISQFLSRDMRNCTNWEVYVMVMSPQNSENFAYFNRSILICQNMNSYRCAATLFAWFGSVRLLAHDQTLYLGKRSFHEKSKLRFSNIKTFQMKIFQFWTLDAPLFRGLLIQTWNIRQETKIIQREIKNIQGDSFEMKNLVYVS